MARTLTHRVFSVMVPAGAAMLLGCAAGPYQDPGQALAAASLAGVKSLSEQTAAYLGTGKTEAEAMAAAQQVAAEQLKDPEAARFRNVRVKHYLDGKIVCGEINGKNGYGAYVGYVPFAASPFGAVLTSTESRYSTVDDLANMGIRSACS